MLEEAANTQLSVFQAKVEYVEFLEAVTLVRQSQGLLKQLKHRRLQRPGGFAAVSLAHPPACGEPEHLHSDG